MSYNFQKYDSPVGTLYLIADESALCAIIFKQMWHRFSAKFPVYEDVENAVLKDTRKQLVEYFSGKRQNFDIKLNPIGTNFQKSVWHQLNKIPYGETVSYRDIAKRIKNDKAVRAVGTANGHNPISIIVPCHRVIAADGTLGGYSGGLDTKTTLLKLEQSV